MKIWKVSLSSFLKCQSPLSKNQALGWDYFRWNNRIICRGSSFTLSFRYWRYYSLSCFLIIHSPLMHRSFELDKTFFMFLQLSSILFVLLFGFFYVTLFSHCTSLHLALYIDSMVSFPWPLIQYFVSWEFLCCTR